MKKEKLKQIQGYMKKRGASAHEIAMFIQMCKRWKPESMFRSFRKKT